MYTATCVRQIDASARKRNTQTTVSAAKRDTLQRQKKKKSAVRDCRNFLDLVDYVEFLLPPSVLDEKHGQLRANLQHPSFYFKVSPVLLV